jgi:hypothetical protein
MKNHNANFTLTRIYGINVEKLEIFYSSTILENWHEIWYVYYKIRENLQ